MTETEARRALLLRAFEQPSPTAPWTAADADAVTRQALQRVGEHAAAAPFTAERACLGTEQLARHEPAVDAALAATGPHRGLRRAVVVLAALAGALSDAVGPVGALQRINILAPPLFALLVWNLAVYAALAVAAIGRGSSAMAAAGTGGWRRPADPATAASPDIAHEAVAADGPLRRLLGRGWRAVVRRTAVVVPAGSPAAAPLARFIADWWRSGAALNAARLAGSLHAAAAAFALAAIASLYVRGLGFEYRAGWDSTFLTPAAVHRLLKGLFAPALVITGLSLPDAEALARLRFANGAGENAARWIHLQALTIALFVVLPRGVLAVLAARRARRLAGDFALPPGDPYFERLARLPGGRALVVQVLPYGWQPPADAPAALAAVLERLHGGAVAVRVSPAVPLGGEDEPSRWAPALDGAPVVGVLFTSTATPERENHGAFVAAVAARLAPPGRLQVLVDESAFHRRFAGSGFAVRLDQRREAWQRVLAEQGASAPCFVDLGAGGAVSEPPLGAADGRTTRPVAGR